MTVPQPQHISTIPVGRINVGGYAWISGPPEPDGLCHCKELTAVSPIGECQTCHRLVVAR